MFEARSGTIVRVAGGTLAVLAVIAASALAAAPRKGATYEGTLNGSRTPITISLHVSAAGGKVESLRISSLPIYCAGKGPPGALKISFENAKISASGSFSSPGKDVIASGPLKGSVAATLFITGSFTGAGHESGMLTTTYTGPAAKCGGRSSYRTTG